MRPTTTISDQIGCVNLSDAYRKGGSVPIFPNLCGWLRET